MIVLQYLELGKYREYGGRQALDKNLTNLLSRTDLLDIFAQITKEAEKTDLEVINFNEEIGSGKMSGRKPDSALMNNELENAAVSSTNMTCKQFVEAVFTQDKDRLTTTFGGFKTMPHEAVGARSRRQQAPVFELRNMVPAQGENDRFAPKQWVPLAQNLIELLNTLNIEQEKKKGGGSSSSQPTSRNTNKTSQKCAGAGGAGRSVCS